MRRSEGGDVAADISVASVSVSHATTVSVAAFPPMHTSPPSSGVLLLGKLMRRDRRFLTWKWRDFVLERSRLQYFSQKGNRKGDIPLTPQTPITIRMVNEPKPFGFLLFIKDSKLTLAAASERERRQWIDVFCDVFHASVEQAQPDNKAERRARPTFLPVPDMGDSELDHDSSTSNLLVQQSTSMSVESDFADSGTPVMNHNNLDYEHIGSTDRSSLGADVIPMLESRMTCGPMKEMNSRITFPPSLANSDLLAGVGPIVRRVGWTDERILAVGMYIEPETATKELEKFNGRVAKSLYGDQEFYDHLLFHTTFRRSFVITARKRVSKSVLRALLHDELAPRMGPNAVALQTFLGFIEKSLKKAESMVMRVHEDDRFEFRLRGQLYPPIASHSLCKCIQAIFFDTNSIQHDAKRGLVERLPSLWGGEVLDAQDEIFGSLHAKIQGMESDDEDDSDSDEDDNDDDDSDDSEAEDLFGAADHGQNENHHHPEEDKDQDDQKRSSIKAEHPSEDNKELPTEQAKELPKVKSAVMMPPKPHRARKHSHSEAPHLHRQPSTTDEWAEYDEQELEMLRRESRSLIVHFGAMLDPDTKCIFSGDLVVDGSALLGTWSHKFSVSPDEYDAPYDTHQYQFAVGLYVDPGAISESLLKYKGLSIGSIIQDTDYFNRFASGKFQKHLVFKVATKMKLRTLLDFFDTRFCTVASAFEEVKTMPESLVSRWNKAHPQEQQLELCPKDEARFSISADGSMVLRVKKRCTLKDDKKHTPAGSSASSSEEAVVQSVGSADSTATNTSHTVSSGDSNLSHAGSSSGQTNFDSEMALSPPPYYLGFQSILFGFHAIDPSARTQLMERLPNLLDLARDDLVHTYHDEIQALRENYKRQKPENRVKVGYLSISFEKRKMQKNAEKGGAREATVVPSRWSKRWCRLDGTLFSYYSHKRSRKYRDMMELTRCEVVEITANSAADVARFGWEKGDGDSIRIAIIKPNGEILALRTETIYEGEEWLESLTDASNVRRGSSADHWAAWDTNVPHLRRRSSSTQHMIPGRNGRSESATSALTSERHSSVGNDTERNATVHTAASGAANDDDDSIEDGYDSDQELVEKDGSLVAWVQEDPRHAIIALLLGLIVYLASVMHRSQSIEVVSSSP